MPRSSTVRDDGRPSAEQVTSVIAPVRLPKEGAIRGAEEETCVLVGGDPFSPGAKVKPAVLSILASIQSSPIPESLDGRRKGLADWIANADNPLFSRAIVNRLWMWHFDQPIAGNPNNFGSTGKKPTHPELLDWLAARLVEENWSIKAMHRIIMNSAAYRRSSKHIECKSVSDLERLSNCYAQFKPRRLSAEEIRDCMLAASGELNRSVGGIPNRPEINLEAAMQPRQVMGTYAAAWLPNPRPEQRHRRSLYALKLRGLADPALEVFNAPTPDFSCERREISSVTPQVFSLFNGRASYARALALADRGLRESSDASSALQRIFALVFGRPATDDETQMCLEHWHRMEKIQSQVVYRKIAPDLEIRRDAVEENTGERFSFVESLYSNKDFVADLHPADCNARTRALADVCLVILNANEFVYVY